MMTQAIVTDGHTLNPGDLDWSILNAWLELSIYDHTLDSQLEERAYDAEVLIVNKTIIGEKQLSKLPKLRCIILTATGYNNLDLEALKLREVVVYNVKGYGAYSVSQHVMACILYFTNGVAKHGQSVKNGDWAISKSFSYSLFSMIELHNKVLGIFGFGAIGKRTAELGIALGMKVLVHSSFAQEANSGISFVSMDDLFKTSDFISIHAKLDVKNEGIIDAELLNKMKPEAYIINTARAQLINEDDLYLHLSSNKIMGAALDVLPEEPPTHGNKMMSLENCLITPHNAWATRASRQRLLEITAQNIEDYFKGCGGDNRLV